MSFATEWRGGEDTDAATIALTPTAHRVAEATGVSLAVFDDFVDRRQLFGDTNEYLRWQVDWLRRIAAETDDPEVALSCAQYIKPLVDSVVVWSRLLHATALETQPSLLRYVGPAGDEEQTPWHNEHLQFWPLLGDLPLAARLLPRVADELSVPFEVVVTDRRLGPGCRSHRDASVGGALRRTLAPVRHLGWSASRDTRARRNVVFVWSGGYGARPLADACRAKGARILLLERSGPTTTLLMPSWRGYRRISRGVRVEPDDPSPLSPALVSLLAEVEDWSGLAGSAATLGRRLEYFVGAICPAVSRAAVALEPLLRSSDVETLFAANASTIEEFAAIIAARRADVETVLVQHGDHLFRYDAWLITETLNFDKMVCSDPSVPGDLRTAAAALGVAPPVTAHSTHRRLSRSKSAQTCGKTVHYVPGSFTGDTAVLPLVYFDDAWYQRWRSALFALMSRRPDTRFVWKGLPGSDQAADPFAAELPTRNVRYESRPLPSVLSDIDRAIIDFPSTPLYELASASIPVLALWFPRFSELRPRATELFTPVLRRVKTIDEGLAAVEAFLDDDPREWIVSSKRLSPPPSASSGACAPEGQGSS